MTNQFSNNVSQVLAFSREEAVRLSCKYVGPEHLLLGMLRDRQHVAQDILELSAPEMSVIKTFAEERVRGNGQAGSNDAAEAPVLDEHAGNILKLSVLEARLQRSQTVDVEHVLLAILHDRSDNGAKLILEKMKINYDKVLQHVMDRKNRAIDGIGVSEEDDSEDVGRSHNDTRDSGDFAAGRASGGKPTGTPVLDKFATDLTAAAKKGTLDPVVGREKEIERVIEILCRRKKNNPILIGEPGVGKSAIAEGIAQLIADRRTSPLLFNKRLFRLDMTAVVAGTKYRGQFEERIQALLRELEGNDNIIIFIDEIHTLVGAGSTQGSMDAANIMKPALARGVVQCIGATTLDEYRNSIEKDGALERRFQKVMVEPSTEEETRLILDNIKPRYERHHHVRYSDDAIKACVRLTGRYVTERFFPDKAIDALDEAGAKVRLKSVKKPAYILEKESKINETALLTAAAAKDGNYETATAYRGRLAQLEKELEEMYARWQARQDDEPTCVEEKDVAEVVSVMSGVPLQKVSRSESAMLKDMERTLKKTVIAQDKAISKVARCIQRNRLGLKDPNRPVGVFMFLGPTGVGKTHLARTLADQMFGSPDALIRIDMSEYSEKFTTSRLVGAPPGYVGYGEGGQLTEKVRRHPYSIVLLDEIEKAHGDVFNLLLQVLDEGRMTDGNGRTVDFKNTVIIMTSNAGTRQLKDFGKGIGFDAASANDDSEKSREYAREIIRKALTKQFPPEFLNRLDDIITFDSLDRKAIVKIVKVEIEKLSARMAANGHTMTVTESALDFLTRKGYDPQYGARPVKRAIQEYVEEPVCEFLLDTQATQGVNMKVDLNAGGDGLSVSLC